MRRPSNLSQHAQFRVARCPSAFIRASVSHGGPVTSEKSSGEPQDRQSRYPAQPGLTPVLPQAIIVSAALVAELDAEGRSQCVPLGATKLKGKANDMEVFGVADASPVVS